MPSIGNKIIPLGRTYHGATSAVDDKYYDSTQSDFIGETAIGLEGTVCQYRSPDPTDRTKKLVNGDVTLVLVRNTCTGTLLPGQCVTWESGFRYKRVDGNSRTTGQEIAGVVDPFLNATNGVQVGDLFWLFVKGLCMIEPGYDGSSNVWSAGSRLAAFTCAGSTGATGSSTGGKLEAFTTNYTIAATLAHNVRAIAVSAATAAETGGRSAFPTSGKLVFLISDEY
jgi:hypothetical protein